MTVVALHCRHLPFSRLLLRAFGLGILWLATASSVLAQPTFSKAFQPNVIGPGSHSRLLFTIASASAGPVIDLAFTDNLPAGVTLGSPASATTTCTGGTVSAPSGGSVITFSGGTVGPNTSCTVAVDVASSVVGTHMNVSGDLTSSGGNSGPAIANLTVAADRPGFSKSFLPAAIGLGGRSTLTLLIDNTVNPSLVVGVSFTDNLPPGLEIADPAGASTTCSGAMLTASPGMTTISILGSFVLAGESCTVTVDVKGIGVAQNVNRSGELLSSVAGPQRTSGFAVAALPVTAGTITLIKEFTDDPVNPGDTVTLEFTIANRDRDQDATGIAFTDDLDATLSGLVATGLPMNGVCGPGSVLSGTSVISLTGGNLPAEGVCTFSVTLQVPAAATPGGYPNTTSNLTASLGGSPFTGAPGTDSLFVNDAPVLTKTFLPSLVGGGDMVSMEFTITNTSSTSAATNISFMDNLDQWLSSSMVTALPPSGFCGPGSTISQVILSSQRFLSMSGGNLPAGGSCTFTVDHLVAVGTPEGDYLNQTTAITAIVDGTTQTGNPAMATLTVAAAPTLTKSFTDDPVEPGDTVTLEFTLTRSEEASGDALDVAFTDDLDATLSGLVAVGLPMNDVCGTGSVLSGTSVISLSGGSLMTGTSCTFSVTLQVPAAAVPGTYPNTTSDVTATVGGVSVAGTGGADDLLITSLDFTKEFLNDPTIPGDLVTLEFTLTNTSPTATATNISFTDNLGAVLPGLAAEAPLPVTPCGAGSQIVGTNMLVFTGGNLLPNTSCTFSVMVRVPAATPSQTYLNTTSNLTADIDGTPVVLPPAADRLEVNGEQLLLAKSFTNDPVAAGSTVTLEFTVTNTNATQPATGITFTDDLAAALPGLAAIGLPMMNVCGAGSQISGTTLLTLSGGNLPAGSSCTFSVTLQVPGGAAAGLYTNTTSMVSGTINGLGVVGAPASDVLRILGLTFSKNFASPAFPGGTVMLEFTITNLDAVNPASAIQFTDDLDAVLAGLVATGLPAMNVCGAGSQISGTSFLTFNNGELAAGGSCTFGVTLQVPAGAAPGSYLNTTSQLFQGGLVAAAPATDTLGIEPPPTFAKVFAPDVVSTTQPSTLTFTIDNTASTLAVTGLDFTDNLPAGLLVATPAGASTTCTGGTLTAVPGTGLIAYSGGSVAAGTTCTVQADVAAATAGTYVNTSGDLTSSAGNSGTATDTLEVEAAPLFSKAFAPTTVGTGQPSTLTFTIDNTASTLAVTGLDFTDNLPAGLLVATPANASTTCTGGTLTAAPGTGVISYTGGSVAAGATCSVQADVAAAAPGTYDNTSGPLTSSAGSSGTASATLTVIEPPAFAKAFAPNVIVATGISTLTFTIDNTTNPIGATSLAFTDNLPASVVVATPAGASTTCTGGTLTAAPGTGVITYTGGSVAAGATCTVQADVTSATPGSYVNTSGDLTSSLGNSGPATDTLEVKGDVLAFSKAFLSNPNLPGATVALEYTIENLASVTPVTGLTFTDDLDAALTGLVATGLPVSNVCGAGSQVSGTSQITLTGGNLAPGTSCTFQVTLQIPGTAAEGTYPSTSGPLTGTAGGVTVQAPAAMDDLEIVLLDFFKEFPDVQASGGSTTLLRFVIMNPSASTATGITFTDDLEAVLPGLMAIDTPQIDICGTGSQLTGTSLLTLSGGVLGPQESCTITVTLEIPPNTLGGTYSNVTSVLEATVGGSTLAITEAQADLTVESIILGIPTLGETGLAVLIGLLLLAGVWRLRMR